jgi:GNAT superfamily N-acetyltransferase
MARQPERDIFALFVLPQFEGGGIGTLLLDAAVNWLCGNGPKPIRLNTERTTKAFRFYINRGWHETGLLEDGDPVLELSN